MKYFVANWKAHKNLDETRDWLEYFTKEYRSNENVTVIVAPPFPFLQEVTNAVKQLENVHVASQDLSSFEEGNYTGEVTARSIQGLVEYFIAGHSERGKYFGESRETIAKKVELAGKYGIKTILCIRGAEDEVISGVEMVAYEPLGAIGTGYNSPVDEVLRFRKSLHLNESVKFLYGGSVNDENVSEYLRSDQIDGLLVGGASLDPASFLKTIHQV